MPAKSAPNEPFLEVLKVGSDPEALFHDDQGVVSALRYVGSNNNLRAWIGTDGCSSTAEFRPRPARDVRVHVRELAEALAVVRRLVCEKEPKVTMLAQPYLPNHGSPCGGHIHLSFLLHDALAAPIIANGEVFNMTGSGLRDCLAADGIERFGAPQERRADYLAAANADRAFGLRALNTRLNAFFYPLDFGLHNVTLRMRRQYGNSEDALRLEHRPIIVKQGVLKWRLEYRFPATWLAHPAQALTYLGLAKLILNNYHTLPSNVRLTEPINVAEYLEGFYQNDGAVVTEDVRHLPKILRYVIAEVRPRLQGNLVRIDFDAWSTFLNEGRFK